MYSSIEVWNVSNQIGTNFNLVQKWTINLISGNLYKVRIVIPPHVPLIKNFKYCPLFIDFYLRRPPADSSHWREGSVPNTNATGMSHPGNSSSQPGCGWRTRCVQGTVKGKQTSHPRSSSRLTHRTDPSFIVDVDLGQSMRGRC